MEDWDHFEELDDASTWFSGAATGNGLPGGVVTLRSRAGGFKAPPFCNRRGLGSWSNQVERTDRIATRQL
jgi:hypothetical protein